MTTASPSLPPVPPRAHAWLVSTLLAESTTMRISSFPTGVALLRTWAIGMVAIAGCGPSATQKQQTLKQQHALVQQQQALQQLLAAQQPAQPQVSTPQATPAPTAPPDRRACPNFRGQFIYPGDTPVTVEQEGCSTLRFRHQDGTTAIVILDGQAHTLRGDDGQSIVRTSAWQGKTVHIDDRIYPAAGRYAQRGIRQMGIDAQGNIVLRTELHAVIDGKEVPEGNPIVNVARRVGPGSAPIHP